MKKAALVLLLNLFSVGAIFAQKDFPVIKPAKTYKLTGVKIVSPNQTDWQIVKAESAETVFAKTDAEGKFNVFAKTGALEVYENVNDLFDYLEKTKQAALAGLSRDSLHFNRTNFKETPCLQYDGIFINETKTEADYKYFNLYGYLCRHPSAKNLLVQLEFSNHSNRRGFSETVIKLSREFFDKIEFSKVKEK